MSDKTILHPDGRPVTDTPDLSKTATKFNQRKINWNNRSIDEIFEDTKQQVLAFMNESRTQEQRARRAEAALAIATFALTNINDLGTEPWFDVHAETQSALEKIKEVMGEGK